MDFISVMTSNSSDINFQNKKKKKLEKLEVKEGLGRISSGEEEQVVSRLFRHHSSLMRFNHQGRSIRSLSSKTTRTLPFLRVLALLAVISTPLPSSECSTISTTNVFPTESRLSHNFISSNSGSNMANPTLPTLDENEILLSRLRFYWECRLEQRQHEYHLQSRDSNEVSDLCPVTFDGWVCWEATQAGSQKVVTCPPSYYPTTDNQSVRSAIRRCFANSTWEEAVESENDEETPLAHPCSATHTESLRQDNIFWMVIASTSEIEADMYPYGEDVIAESYEACVLTTLSIPPSLPHAVSYCPRTFDGWSCWNDTLAGNIAYVNCPSYGSPGFDSKRLAHKVCSDDGTWFRHPTTNRIWSNYTTCVDREDLHFREQINNLYITGYSVSVTALIISLIIFFVFNSLKCGRVTIHKNLFVSFIINNVLWIIWYTAIVPYPEVLYKNPATCQVLHVMLQYFLVCTYFWMFCEGLYLHTLLVLAFVSEPRIMRMLYVIGWGLPLVLIIIYTSVRMSYDDAVVFCWIEEHGTSWILSGPVGVSMFLNLAFLINIVRVLVTKLRAVNSPDNHHTRKAARATLILIPLLGLHYVIVPFRPEPGSHGERIYQTTAAIATSFQGFCVALLFCFFNGEVIALVRKRWKQEIMMRQKDRRTSYAATTISIGARHHVSEETQSSRASNASQKLMSEL